MADTYHDKRGKFCNQKSANVFVSAGKKYKIVRQKRLMGDNGKIVCNRKSTATEAIHRSNLARMKMVLNGDLSAKGFVNVHREFFDG